MGEQDEKKALLIILSPHRVHKTIKKLNRRIAGVWACASHFCVEPAERVQQDCGVIESHTSYMSPMSHNTKIQYEVLSPNRAVGKSVLVEKNGMTMIQGRLC